MGNTKSRLTPEAAVEVTKQAAAAAFKSEPQLLTEDSSKVHGSMKMQLQGNTLRLGDVMTLTGPISDVAATAEFLVDNTVKRALALAIYYLKPDASALKKLSKQQNWSNLTSYSGDWVTLTNTKMSLDATEAESQGKFTAGGEPKPTKLTLTLKTPSALPRGSYAMVVVYTGESASLPSDTFKTVSLPPVAIRMFHVL